MHDSSAQTASFLTLSSQGIEPPTNPGRFSQRRTGRSPRVARSRAVVPRDHDLSVTCASLLQFLLPKDTYTQEDYLSFWQNTTGPFRDWYKMLKRGVSPQAGAVNFDGRSDMN